MKKQSFYTMCIENNKPVAVLVNGYYDKETDLYYYQDKMSFWHSVCILSGLAIASYCTSRKECVAKTIERLPAYIDMRKRPLFNERVIAYNKAVMNALRTR